MRNLGSVLIWKLRMAHIRTGTLQSRARNSRQRVRRDLLETPRSDDWIEHSDVNGAQEAERTHTSA